MAIRAEQLAALPSRIPDEAVIETESGLMIAPNFYHEVNTVSQGGVTTVFDGASFRTAHVALGRLNEQRWTSEEDEPVVGYLGFTDWRMPNVADVESIFRGSKNPRGSWALSVGYPEGKIDDTHSIFVENVPLQDLRTYNLKVGRMSEPFACMGPIGENRNVGKCYRYSYTPRLKWGPYARLLPVRQPGEGELYFYPD